jgi:hypothetical protein
MLYLRYALFIIFFFYTTISFSCGALNGKGLECNLIDLDNLEDNNYFLYKKNFFYFKNKEIYQIYFDPNLMPIKLRQVNFGKFVFNSDMIQWKDNKYLLNRKNFKLTINIKATFYYRCIILGRPLETAIKYFKPKIDHLKDHIN